MKVAQFDLLYNFVNWTNSQFCLHFKFYFWTKFGVFCNFKITLNFILKLENLQIQKLFIFKRYTTLLLEASSNSFQFLNCRKGGKTRGRNQGFAANTIHRIHAVKPQNLNPIFVNAFQTWSRQANTMRCNDHDDMSIFTVHFYCYNTRGVTLALNMSSLMDTCPEQRLYWT